MFQRKKTSGALVSPKQCTFASDRMVDWCRKCSICQWRHYDQHISIWIGQKFRYTHRNGPCRGRNIIYTRLCRSCWIVWIVAIYNSHCPADTSNAGAIITNPLLVSTEKIPKKLLELLHCGSPAKLPAGLQQKAPCAKHVDPHVPKEQLLSRRSRALDAGQLVAFRRGADVIVRPATMVCVPGPEPEPDTISRQTAKKRIKKSRT
jgi:hypothetical protein